MAEEKKTTETKETKDMSAFYTSSSPTTKKRK